MGSFNKVFATNGKNWHFREGAKRKFPKLDKGIVWVMFREWLEMRSYKN
jgi:uncharacterized membrane protein